MSMPGVPVARPSRSRSLLLLIALPLSFAFPTTSHAQIGPDLAVTKTCVVDGQANGQQSILCTVTITNIGANASLAPISLADTPVAATGSTYIGAGGTLPISCSPGTGPVLPIACTANLPLAPAASGTAMFSFRVPAGSPFSNCVTVTVPRNAASPGDLSPSNNTSICARLAGGGGDGDGDDRPGSVTFAKVVINKTRNPTPRQFDIQYQCQPDMSTVVNLSLTAPGYQHAVPVPAGAQCKFTEVAPPAPKGCQWIVSYPDGQYGKEGDRLVVQNELECGDGGGGGGDGEITFVKKILNETGQRVAGPFEVEVKCQPGPGPGRVLLAAPGFSQTVAVAAGAKCKFQEVLPDAPKGCRWTVAYPDGQQAAAGDTVRIENVLTCGDGDGGNDGGGGDGEGPTTCPVGSSLTTFAGSNVRYCCNGKPGNDEFCCTRARPARKLPGKR